MYVLVWNKGVSFMYVIISVYKIPVNLYKTLVISTITQCTYQ